MQMIDQTRRPLGPGDPAPDFELPAADTDGRVALAEYRRRGPVLLTMLRGLYCPFCRRQISQLRPTSEVLRAAGIALLGVVIASPERSRRYFRHFPSSFPLAAAPDRTLHRAYRLPEVVRTPEGREAAERQAAEILRGLGIQAPPGQAATVFATAGGFEMTVEDEAEWQRSLQTAGYFLIGPDGVIRWSSVGLTASPSVEELLPLV